MGLHSKCVYYVSIGTYPQDCVHLSMDLCRDTSNLIGTTKDLHKVDFKFLFAPKYPLIPFPMNFLKHL